MPSNTSRCYLHKNKPQGTQKNRLKVASYRSQTRARGGSLQWNLDTDTRLVRITNKNKTVSHAKLSRTTCGEYIRSGGHRWVLRIDGSTSGMYIGMTKKKDESIGLSFSELAHIDGYASDFVTDGSNVIENRLNVMKSDKETWFLNCENGELYGNMRRRFSPPQNWTYNYAASCMPRPTNKKEVELYNKKCELFSDASFHSEFRQSKQELQQSKKAVERRLRIIQQVAKPDDDESTRHILKKKEDAARRNLKKIQNAISSYPKRPLQTGDQIIIDLWLPTNNKKGGSISFSRLNGENNIDQLSAYHCGVEGPVALTVQMTHTDNAVTLIDYKKREETTVSRSSLSKNTQSKVQEPNKREISARQSHQKKEKTVKQISDKPARTSLTRRNKSQLSVDDDLTMHFGNLSLRNRGSENNLLD